jgi:hypothetical protein
VLGLDQLASVYVETAATGKYTTLSQSNVACRLVNIPLNRIQRPADRRELSAMRDMLFDPAVSLPEQCQIEVDAVRWQVLPGTFAEYRDWNSNIAYKRCDVLRQEVNSF